MTSHQSRLVVLATALPMWMFGQTTVDLRTQSKAADFGAAPFTRPFSTGTVLPATCTVGYMFYKSNAPAGQNLYGCTATNIWTLEAGGAGASAATQLTDIAPVLTSSAVASGTFASDGTVLGQPGYSTAYTGSWTIALSAGSAASATTFYVYQDPTSPSSLKVDTTNSSFNGVTLSGISQGHSSASGYPADVTPLYRLTAGDTTANQWDPWSTCAPNALTGCIDDRAWLGKTIVKAGTDLSSSVSNGVKTINADNTILTQKFVGAGAPGSIAGNLAGDLYSDTTDHAIYQCNAAAGTPSPACTSVAMGGWTQLNGGGSGSFSVKAPFLYDGTNCYIGPYYQTASIFSTSGFSLANGSPALSSIGSSPCTGERMTTENANLTDYYLTSVGSHTTVTSAMACTIATYSSSDPGCGLALYESSSGKGMRFMIVSATSGNQNLIVIQSTTSFSYSGNVDTLPNLASGGAPLWLKIVLGSTIDFYLSGNGGASWQLVYGAAESSYFTSAPNEWGFAVDATSGALSSAMDILSWSVQ